LRSCAIPLPTPIENGFCALYGSTERREAFLWAKLYAKNLGLQFTVVDLVVSLERELKPGVVHPEDLPSRDFLSLERVSRGTSDLLSMAVGGDKNEPPSRDRPDKDRIQRVLLSDPGQIDALVESPACRHIKLFAIPTRTLLVDTPITLGIIPYHHWSAVTAAHCRLDPEVSVLL